MNSKGLLGQQPKEEIGAAQFIAKNPAFDGRGVIVGVFDTGVDPGAPGLLTTTTGAPKVIDIVDCTGSGDVDTSKTASPVDGKLTGLSGRTLTLPHEWPTIAEGGKYHLGIKPAYELMPKPLITRMQGERRKKLIDESQRGAVAAAQRELREPREDARKEDKRRDEELKARPPATCYLPPATCYLLPATCYLTRAAHCTPLATCHLPLAPSACATQARVAQLEALQKAYEDPGPVYDVLTYKDSRGTWRVCVDTSECGALGGCALLAPYRLEQQYGAPRTTDHLPPTSYCLPPTTDHLPPTAYCLPPTTDHLPPTAYCLLYGP